MAVDELKLDGALDGATNGWGARHRKSRARWQGTTAAPAYGSRLQVTAETALACELGEMRRVGVTVGSRQGRGVQGSAREGSGEVQGNAGVGKCRRAQLCVVIENGGGGGFIEQLAIERSPGS